MTEKPDIPLAAYRIQLSKDFTFDDAAAVAEYLQALNVSHIYLSPVMRAVPGSNHGYDVLDFSQVSDERGGYEGLQRLCARMGAMNPPLSLILDIVPNHMAASTDNPYWRDVLRCGRTSPCWKLFDFKADDDEKIRLPVLGSQSDEAIAKGEIQLASGDNGLPVIKYFDLTFPLNDVPSSGSLADILACQHYELVPWTDTQDRLSYRRFFDVTGLVGIRVEDENVYQKTHSALFALLGDFPCVDGIRADHIDGLSDPKTYLQRLSHDAQRKVWVEKILAPDEEIPASWPINGTTGYEFIDHANRLFVHPGNFSKIRDYWLHAVESEWKNFSACVAASKAEVLHALFSAELTRLAGLSTMKDEQKPQAKLFWSGLTIGLDVYRVYGDDEEPRIRRAAARAREIFGPSFAMAADKFMPSLLSPRTEREKQAACEWRQLSGPVMAKGLEDTAHYRYTPLAALNEVGCASDIRAENPADFFAWMNHRARQWPDTLNATSTHDTKRAEDVRHRLYALADRPEEWTRFYEEAARLAAPFSTIRPATKYFLCQAILGTWPMDGIIDESYIDRISNYMIKACREAKRETSWLKPAADYETSVMKFVRYILSNEEFLTLARRIATWLSPAGAINSLSVQMLKILSPGVPDIYQGTEIWDFSLVDPDNRRPVDFKYRETLLAALHHLERIQGRRALLRRLLETWRDGGIKLWLTQTLLQIRRDHLMPLPSPLTAAPLEIEGPAAGNFLAWSLSDISVGEGLIAVCPRYSGTQSHPSPNSLKIVDAGDTHVKIPPNLRGGTFRNLITGETVNAVGPIAALIADFPVAVISFRA